jgi:hypothetical protein
MLLPNAQSFDHSTIAGVANATQIVEQTSTSTHQEEKPAPGLMIFLVELKMLRQVRDPIRQHRDLDFRRARIRLMLPVLLDQLGLGFFE